jgi:serine/threonine protein kinase
VHARKLLHLDIKPANIYLRLDGSPVLLDFGAARQALENDRPTLKPMYTPGFAAPEQYEAPDQLGPWTDIYAVGASMYATLGGSVPTAADARLETDTLEPAVRRWSGRYSRQLLETVDWCLQLDYLERPLSVLALQKALASPERATHEASWVDALSRKLKRLVGTDR